LSPLTHDVTELLHAWGGGDVDARKRVVALASSSIALTKLAAFDPRKSRIAELRFFGGLSLEETGHVLDVSPATVDHDWQGARAWLFKTLSAEPRVFDDP
jgi:DNA-directed RNA polymerase specialized sigma24 family protein